MNKERLQEIKDSIDFQREFLIASNMQTLCVDEEMELYNEIIRLKKQKDDVVEYIKNNKLFNYVYDEEELFEIITDKQAKNDLLRMLGEIDNEYEKNRK